MLERKRQHTIRKEAPQHLVLSRILTTRQTPRVTLVPPSLSHHSTPHIADYHFPLYPDRSDSIRILGRHVCSASQAIVARYVIAVSGP